MIIQGKRAIAYFDIMGFKAKLNNLPLSRLSTEYERLIEQTDGEFFISEGTVLSRQVCYRYIFSDSIFLIAKEDTEESAIDLLSYSWRMMQIFIAGGYPLRGAATYGDIYANFEINVFLGKPIAQAVILEGSQDWIGAIVDNSVFEHYKGILKGESIQCEIMNTLFPEYPVYFKNGTRPVYHVINWRQNMISENGIKPLFKNEPYCEDVQRKIDNTLCFSKSIVDSKTAYFNSELVPERYRNFYIAKSAPPQNGHMFTNGDEY